MCAVSPLLCSSGLIRFDSIWEASTLVLYLAKSNAQFMTLNPVSTSSQPLGFSSATNLRPSPAAVIPHYRKPTPPQIYFSLYTNQPISQSISFTLIIVRVCLGFGYKTKGAEGEMPSVPIRIPMRRSTSAHTDSIAPSADIEFVNASEYEGEVWKFGAERS